MTRRATGQSPTGPARSTAATPAASTPTRAWRHRTTDKSSEAGSMKNLCPETSPAEPSRAKCAWEQQQQVLWEYVEDDIGVGAVQAAASGEGAALRVWEVLAAQQYDPPHGN
eukprot:CAMPEP_0177776872 /NCGR_PEP_ID=MMETSP0491_2-20121128/14964_1 /TAXON_ID=63592 /ORGANISM="Tetraselmis chuii, Strain PLY429" /LENGTH=111 /DNA_ID=CAMNT_0019295731 /DNA_START=322 /DNA_END=658 /DNA_ORIENTATION=-